MNDRTYIPEEFMLFFLFDAWKQNIFFVYD